VPHVFTSSLLSQVWVDFATWHVDAGRADDAAAVFKRAMRALPHCLLLHFSYADLVEAEGLVAEAQAVYDALLQQYKEAEAKALADEGDDEARDDAAEVRTVEGLAP
jgi:predicted Zn-dependent protease